VKNARERVLLSLAFLHTEIIEGIQKNIAIDDKKVNKVYKLIQNLLTLIEFI
jgi:hypothetical protein